MSHQWVSKRHPDPEFRQMSVLQEALKQLLVSKSVPLDIATESGVPGAKPLPLHEFQSASVFLWYDYFSIPQMEDRSTFGADQSDGSKQADAINSIPAYVAKCKYFMALCPVIDCSEEDKVLSCATWGSHLLDRVLALGLQASAVVGPFTRGGSKDPGWGRSAAIGMEVFECVLAPAGLCRAGDAVSPIVGSLGLACGFLPGSGFAGGWFRPGLRVGWVVLHQQCRLPLHLFRRLSRLLGYAGCRVGEASHPGPGASKAARRKQLQQQQVQQSVQRQVLALLEALVGLLSGGQTNGLPASPAAGNHECPRHRFPDP